MYADFFGLTHLPFNNSPDPRFFYATPDHEEALASLIYAVHELKGCVLLTGEVGTGKTLVSRMMMRQFGDHVKFANITHSTRSALDLMESVCAEFNLRVPPGASNAQLVRILQDYLLAQFANNHPVVLVLDEAQNLSIDAFEQLRMIGNLESDDAKLLQIVILGQPELQRLIRSPQLRQLHQRIFRSFHLTALSRPITGDYIRHRLTVAGADSSAPNASPDIFEEQAIDHVHAFSQGLPRLINTACDNAMLSAYSSDRSQIDGAFMATVIDQLSAEAQSVGRTTCVPFYQGEDGVASPLVDGVETPPPQSPPPSQTRRDPNRIFRLLAARLEALEQKADWADTLDIAMGRSTNVQTNAAGVDAAKLDETLAFVRELRRKFDVAAARLVALEHRFNDSAQAFGSAHETMGELKATIEQARCVLHDQRSAAQDAAASHAVAQKLTGTVRTLLEQTRTAASRMNETTAKVDRAEREARRTYQRLRTQAERTGGLSAVVRQVFDRIEHQMQALASGTVVGSDLPGAQCATSGLSARVDAGAPSLPGTGNGRRGTELEHFNHLLDNSREALFDLRSLVRENDTILWGRQSSVVSGSIAPAIRA